MHAFRSTLSALTLLLAACSAVAAKKPAPAVTGDMKEVVATVVSIDQQTRHVTLRDTNGKLMEFDVGPEVKNLDKVQVGDRVELAFFEGIAAEVKKPGTGVKGVKEETRRIDAAPPDAARPAGGVSKTKITTVIIESVDTTANTVTFKDHEGVVHTTVVKKPEGRKFIAGLKPGDEVEVMYTEAVAVSVTPAN
jgi:hypothetical protein